MVSGAPMRPGRRSTIVGVTLAGALAAGVTALAVREWRRTSEAPVLLAVEPPAVMGTRTRLLLVTPRGRAAEARRALASAEATLRDWEARLSAHLEGSQVSRLNAAPAGQVVPVGRKLRELLGTSDRLRRETDGAFDPTCGPVVSLWREAGEAGRLPGPEAIERARSLVGAGLVRLLPAGAVKARDGVAIDLGGLAKGRAADEVVEGCLRGGGRTGGLVDLGGDIRCFGRTAASRPWRVGIRHPFGPRGRSCAMLELTDAAVATSGDYERYVEIDGRRYSHIVDPRTGRPVAGAAGVTVVSLPVGRRGPSAAEADAWATALSVLGPSGLDRLEGEGMEAMIVTGTPGSPRVHATGGFRGLLAAPGKIELD